MLHATPSRSDRHLSFPYSVKLLIGFLLFNKPGVVWKLQNKHTHIHAHFVELLWLCTKDKSCMCSSVNKGEQMFDRKCYFPVVSFWLCKQDWCQKCIICAGKCSANVLKRCTILRHSNFFRHVSEFIQVNLSYISRVTHIKD